MKYTICITRDCNLRCKYCYIGKQQNTAMSIETAKQTVDFIFSHAPKDEHVEIGFFGGEPLLEFDLIRFITQTIKSHPAYNPKNFELTVVTNGTIFNEEIARYVVEQDLGFGISCDGPPELQDQMRVFPEGGGSSATVERNLRFAVDRLPAVMVNAVYHPATLLQLPDTVEYFSSLGIKQIYLSPDFSASWTATDAGRLREVYGKVAEKYIHYYLADKPHYISLIDSKIAVMLRGGYKPGECCRMGRGEYAFAPSGNIYPCERLIGSDDGETHCIGHITKGLSPASMCRHIQPEGEFNNECYECGLKDYCMNWCGCANFFSSGFYNRVGPFLCASERAAIETAFETFQILESRLGPIFVEHLNGNPIVVSKIFNNQSSK